MDKIKINTLGALPEQVETYYDIGEASVMIRRTIPYEQVLEMIQYCVDFIIGDRPFVSGPLKQIVKDFALITFYTNLDTSFMQDNTDMSEIYAEYDAIIGHHVIEKVRGAVDAEQLAFFDRTLDETLKAISEYQNSAVGIVENLSMNAKDSVNDMSRALDYLKDPNKEQQVENLLKLAEEIKP